MSSSYAVVPLVARSTEQQSQEDELRILQSYEEEGVKFVPIKKSPKKEEHPLIVKWTPAFIEAQRDGLPVIHYKNPVTGENDITMIVFDNRVLANTMPQNTSLGSNMSVNKYYEMLEKSAQEFKVKTNETLKCD